MKKFFIIAIVSVVSAISCTKQNSGSEYTLIGKWLWLKSVGGITGNEMILPQEGESRILNFFQDSTYTLTRTGTNPINYTSRYSLVSVIDLSTNRQASAVVLYDEALRPLLPLIIDGGDDNLLKLKENCADCYTQFYTATK